MLREEGKTPCKIACDSADGRQLDEGQKAFARLYDRTLTKKEEELGFGLEAEIQGAWKDTVGRTYESEWHRLDRLDELGPEDPNMKRVDR